MEDKSGLQSNSRPWLFKKGQSGNPSGKPKGTISLKTWVKNKIYSMNDEEREEFLDGLSKEIVWKMAEGNPESKSEVKVDNSEGFTKEELAEAKKILVDRIKSNTTTPSSGIGIDPESMGASEED